MIIKNNFKNIMRIVLILILVFLVFEQKAFANETEVNYENENFVYTVVDEQVTISKYIGKDTNIVIPNKIDQYDVTKIGDSAFDHCSNIVEVVIPDTVTYIGDHVFNACENLTKVSMSPNVTRIGMHTFSYCSKLEEILIPDGVKNIGPNAFRDCSSLKSITIPDTVTYIGDRALQGCTSIKELVIPDSVEYIGEEACSRCINLENVTISKNLTKINKYAFLSCVSLKNIIIPEGVEEINEAAFGDCVYLADITIPNSVKNIANSAFWGGRSEELIRQVDLNIHGYKGSYAETYANEKEINFIVIGEENPSQEDNPVQEDSSKLIEGGFYCGLDYYPVEYGFKYSDEFFKSNEIEYNHHLATMSLCLAYSAYNLNCEEGPFNDPSSYSNFNLSYNLEELLTTCGFKNFKPYNYDVKPTIDNIACGIASKKLSSGETLIAIAVRGGGYESEWGSNFTVGKTGDHEGFKNAADLVYKRLKEYIEENEINGNIKIWITGFSRAGATSNLLAAKLDNRLVDNSAKIGNAIYTKKDIYAYCFATPAGADVSNEPNSDKYSNIFNIVHYHDPVPLVAPQFWGFDRYGTTYVFPFKESLKKSSTYEKNMIKRLNEMGYEYEINNFKDYFYPINQDSMGTYLRKVVMALQENGPIEQFLDGVTDATKLKMTYYRKGLGSRENFVNNGLQDEMRSLMGKDIMTLKGWINSLFNIHEGIFLLCDLHPFLVETGTANANLLVKAHGEPSYYLAWMQSMDSNYVEGAKEKFTDGSGRLLYINCPVNIYVYDSTNKLVTYIEDDVPQLSTDDTLISSIDENGQKVIYLPKDEDYRIEIIARENCKTTITINEYSGVSWDLSKIISYSDVEMKEGEKITATATKYNENNSNSEDESGAIYVLKISDEEILSDVNISQSQIDDYMYCITTECEEQQGTVVGGGIFNIGEFCQVMATNLKGYLFDGWYINNVKVLGEETYRFAVKENANLVAKFKEETLPILPHIHTWDEGFISTPASCIEEGVITYTCTLCGETKMESIDKTKDTLINVSAIAKLALTITEGANSEYILSSDTDLVIVCDGTYSNFKELQLDDVTIDSSNYSVVSGSTKAIIKASYLDTLSEGTHTLKFVYNDDRTAETTIKIVKANTSSSPKTGDNIAIYIALMVISTLGVLGTVIYLRSRYN